MLILGRARLYEAWIRDHAAHRINDNHIGKEEGSIGDGLISFSGRFLGVGESAGIGGTALIKVGDIKACHGREVGPVDVITGSTFITALIWSPVPACNLMEPSILQQSRRPTNNQAFSVMPDILNRPLSIRVRNG